LTAPNRNEPRWPLEKLTYLCVINPTAKEIDKMDEATEVSFLPMSTISEDGRLLSMKTKKLGEVKKGFTYFRDGDVLFAKITPCMENGKRWLANSLVNGVGFGSTEFHVLRPKSKVTAEWIYFYISQQSFRDEAEKSMTGTAGQKRVPKQYLETLLLPVPPLEKQIRLAKNMEKAATLKLKREGANQITGKIIQSIFSQMFGNNPTTSSLSEIVDLVSSGSTPLGGEKTYRPDGIFFIRSQNVLMNELRLDDVAHISEETHKQMRRTWVKNGDVLLNITGASLGRVAVYYGEDDKANVNQHVCIIRPNRSKALPEYIAYYLSLPMTQKELWTIQAGASRQALNFKQVRDLRLYLPSIKEQEVFVGLVKTINKIREKQDFSMKEIEKLFESLLSKSFNGELVT
jgi:type I restriction enzyme, S subunit